MCFVDEIILTLLMIVMNLHQHGAVLNLPFETRTAQQFRTIRIKCEVKGERFIAWETPSREASFGLPAIESINITLNQESGRLRVQENDHYYVLVIEDVKVDDGGNYTCWGSEESKSFTLEVDFFSHGVKTPQRLNYGQNGTIQLELSAYPPLKYHWTKDREELTLPTDGKVMDPYSGSIRITRVGRDDAGMYTCRAVWKEGRPMETEDSVEIEVFVVAYNVTTHGELPSSATSTTLSSSILRTETHTLQSSKSSSLNYTGIGAVMTTLSSNHYLGTPSLNGSSGRMVSDISETKITSSSSYLQQTSTPSNKSYRTIAASSVANLSNDISSTRTSLLPQMSSPIAKVIPSESQLSHTITTNNSSTGLPSQSIRESTTVSNLTATISPTTLSKSMVFNATQQSATTMGHGTTVTESVKSSVHAVNATLATTFPASNAAITATIQTQSIVVKSTQQTAAVSSSKLHALNQSVSDTLAMSPSRGVNQTSVLMSSKSFTVQTVPLLPSSVVLEGNLSLSTVQNKRSNSVLPKTVTSHSSSILLSSTGGFTSSSVASKDTTVQSSVIVLHNTSTVTFRQSSVSVVTTDGLSSSFTSFTSKSVPSVTLEASSSLAFSQNDTSQSKKQSAVFPTASVSLKKSSPKEEFVVTSYATPCYIYYVVEKTVLPVATSNNTAAPSTPTTPRITMEIGSPSKMQSGLPTVTLTHSSAMTTQVQTQASVSTDRVISSTWLVGVTTKSTERTSTKLPSDASPSDIGSIPTSTAGKIVNTVSLTLPSVVTVVKPNSTLKDIGTAMVASTPETEIVSTYSQSKPSKPGTSTASVSDLHVTPTANETLATEVTSSVSITPVVTSARISVPRNMSSTTVIRVSSNKTRATSSQTSSINSDISGDSSPSTAQSFNIFVSPSKSGTEGISINTSQHATLLLSKSGSSSTYMGSSSHRKVASSPSKIINITGSSDVLKKNATALTPLPSPTISGNLQSVASNKTLSTNLNSTPVFIGSLAISSSQTETLLTKHLDLNLSVTTSASHAMGKVLSTETQVNVTSSLLSSIPPVAASSLSAAKDNKTVSTVVENIPSASEMPVPSHTSTNLEAPQSFVGIGGSIVGVKSGLIIFHATTSLQQGGVTLASGSTTQVPASLPVSLIEGTSPAGEQFLSSSSAILEASASILPGEKRRKKRAAGEFGFAASGNQSLSSLTLNHSVTATVASTTLHSGQADSIVLSSPMTSQTLLKANSSSQSAEGGITISSSSEMHLPSLTSSSVVAPQSFVGIGSVVGIKSAIIKFPTTTSSQLGGVTLASNSSTQVAARTSVSVVDVPVPMSVTRSSVQPQSVSLGNSSNLVGASHSLPPENSTSTVPTLAASPSSSHSSYQESAVNGTSVPTSVLISPSSATNSFYLSPSEPGNNIGSHSVMATRSLSSVPELPSKSSPGAVESSLPRSVTTEPTMGTLISSTFVYNGTLPPTSSLDLKISSSAILVNTSSMEGHSFTSVSSIVQNVSASVAISLMVTDFVRSSQTLSSDFKSSSTASIVERTSSLISTFDVDKTFSSTYTSDIRTSSAAAGVSQPSSLASLRRSPTQQPSNASVIFSSTSMVGSSSVTVASSVSNVTKNVTVSSFSSQSPSSIPFPSETVGVISSSVMSPAPTSVMKISAVVSPSMTITTNSRVYKPPLVTISSLGMCYVVYTTRIVQPTLVTTQSFTVSSTATVNANFTSGFLANATASHLSTPVSLNVSTSVVVRPTLQVNFTSTEFSRMDLSTTMFSNFTLKPSSTSTVVSGNSSVLSIKTTTSRAVSTVIKSSSVSETLNVSQSVSKGTIHVISVEKTAIPTSSFQSKSPSVVGTDVLSSPGLSSSTPPPTTQHLSPTAAASQVVSSSVAVPTPQPLDPSLLVETIVKVPNDRDIQSPEFKSELEVNLAKAYSFALVTTRRQRRATPEINVTIDNMERVNNGEVINVTFFVSQDDRKVPASEAVQAYQRLTKAELGNFINFEVVNMPEALVVLPTTSPPSYILVSLIIASSASENISAPANKKKLEDNLAAYYGKQKQLATPVTATIKTIIHEPNNIVYLEFYISVDGTPVNATDVVETFKVPHVNLLNTDLEVEVLVQVYIPDSLTATEADHVIIGVSVSESVDLTSTSFRSDLASKLATVYQNAKGKISSRRKKRSGSTSATIKDAVRKTDSQASEVDVTFFMFDSGKVVNSSYVVSVMNRLSTSQMTSLTRPYAILTAPRQAVVPTTEIPPTVASLPIKWWIIPTVICPVLLFIIIVGLIWCRWKKGAPTSKVDPHRVEMLEKDKRRPVHGFDLARYTEPGVSTGMKTTAFMAPSPTSGTDDEEAEAKSTRRETSLRRKVPKRPIQKLPVREQRQTNPAFEEEEEEEGEESPVSVTPTGSTEALTKGKTSAKPPPFSREHPPAQPQRPVERSELDSEEDSQLSEEESESEPESVAPPEKPSHSPGQIPTVAVMSEASGPPRYPPVRFRSSVHPAPSLPPLDPKQKSLVGVKIEPPSEDDSLRGRRKVKGKRKELEQRAAWERQKNKQRLRERKRNDSRSPESAVVSERRAWDRAQHDIDDALGDDDAERVITGKKRKPRRKRPPSSSVATDEEGVPHLKSYRKLKSPKTASSTSTQDRDKKRGNSVDSASNPSSEEESEIDMNETRRRMHAMLDDAFSLLGPQSAKKPEKIPEGHPSHPVPHPTQVYSSTPARPAVIPRYTGGQPALPEPPPAHGRATEPTPGQRKRVQPTMPGYPVGMPQTPLGMPGYPGRPPVRPVVTRDPIVVWDPADRQRILNQRAPPPTYAYTDPSGQNVYITPVQQQRSDMGGLVWSPYAAEDSMDALYPDLAQASYPGALGTSPPKDASFLSHFQGMPPHDTVLNMSANGTFNQRGSTLGQSPQPLIKSIKDELFRLSQGGSRKTPITEL